MASKGSRPRASRGAVQPGQQVPKGPRSAKKHRQGFVLVPKGGCARVFSSSGVIVQARGHAAFACWNGASGVRQLRGSGGPWWSCPQAVLEVQNCGLLRKGLSNRALESAGWAQEFMSLHFDLVERRLGLKTEIMDSSLVGMRAMDGERGVKWEFRAVGPSGHPLAPPHNTTQPNESALKAILEAASRAYLGSS